MFSTGRPKAAIAGDWSVVPVVLIHLSTRYLRLDPAGHLPPYPSCVPGRVGRGIAELTPAQSPGGRLDEMPAKRALAQPHGEHLVVQGTSQRTADEICAWARVP